MNKQEQIEEMVKTVVDREKNYVIGETECKKCNLNKCDLHCNIHSEISYDCETLYNAGYRKVPECAIILTKEEYDKLGLFEETVQEYKSDKGQPVLVKEQKTLKKYPTDIADFIRKETAKEILTAIGNITVGGLMTKLKYDMDFRNICTKYGVEVE